MDNLLRRNKFFYQHVKSKIDFKATYIEIIIRNLYLIEKLGHFAWRNHAGCFFDAEIENLLLAYGEQLEKLADVDKIAEDINKLPCTENEYTTLHVATEIANVGGHTRVINQIIKRSKETSQHFVLTCCDTANIPEWFKTDIKPFATISSLHNYKTYFDKAFALRLISRRYKRILIYTHPFDIVPTLAFAQKSAIPIAVENHAHSWFWYGRSISDMIFSHTGYHNEFTKKYRLTNSSFHLPFTQFDASGVLPDVSEKAKAKALLKINDGKTVILTVATREKFIPNREQNYFDLLNYLLDKYPDVVFLIVGLSESDPLVENIQKSSRLLFHSQIADLTNYYIAADICLESMPQPSLGVQLLAPVVGLCCPMPKYGKSIVFKNHSLMHSNLYSEYFGKEMSKEDFLEKLDFLLHNPQQRLAIAADIRQFYTKTRSDIMLYEKLMQLYSTLGTYRHKPRLFKDTIFYEDEESHEIAEKSVFQELNQVINYWKGELTDSSLLHLPRAFEKNWRLGYTNTVQGEIITKNEEPIDKLQWLSVKLIAFYLPQYHPIPENDQWWGKGFTEWTNVTKANPLFPGHYQPHLPADLGFYDLRLAETREAQAELARRYGVDGFCYWHYWFSGKRLLDQPFQSVLEIGEPNFPFCLSWANETWSRRWLGEERDILIKQKYSEEDDYNHAFWLINAFKDKRYIKVNDRPLFLVYRPKDLPNSHRTVKILQQVCFENGIEKPYLVGIDAHCMNFDCRLLGFDETLSFMPQLSYLPDFMNDSPIDSKRQRNRKLGVDSAKLKVYDYKESMDAMLKGLKKNQHPFIPSLFVGWDNTPRRGENGIIVTNTSPQKFGHVLRMLVDSVQDRPPQNRFVFVNAWNEWAEGNHLEPDMQSGHKFLEEIKKVKSDCRCKIRHPSVAPHKIAFPEQYASTIRAIAFYLPQYHPISENDEWWGKGFTEWTNVAKAKPLFPGHYQPHVPADLGFYDLRLAEVREKQADLAREHGIYGFCYYHYWFNGKILLDYPLEQVLKSGKPDFPFCLCWANENWTRAWDGQNSDILIRQNYSSQDDLNHIRHLCKIFNDRRYIRIDGKPLFIVYRASNMPDSLSTTSLWRDEARKNGIGELFLCRVERFIEDMTNPHVLGFDAAIEFQPDGINLGKPFEGSDYGSHSIFEYKELVRAALVKTDPAYLRFPCVCPNWDNSPRRRNNAVIFHNPNPKLFEFWLKEVIAKAARHRKEERIVFINAFNEWGEGCHLEPDQRFGKAYLEATRRALMSLDNEDANILQKTSIQSSGICLQTDRDKDSYTFANTGSTVTPIVSIVIPVFNNLKYTTQCIKALSENTREGLYEVVIVDNASTDGTAEFLAGLEGDIKIITNEKNLGFAYACNQGARSTGRRYIVFLNNDTIPHKGWLDALIETIESSDDIGIVGSKLLYPDGTVQHAGVAIVNEKLEACHIYARAASDFPPVNRQRDFQAVTAACMLISRDLFLGIGGFDERYINGNEDLDLCFRVREQGKRIRYCPRSVLTHFESTTPGRQDRMKDNARLLLGTWKARIRPDIVTIWVEDGFRRNADGRWICHQELSCFANGKKYGSKHCLSGYRKVSIIIPVFNKMELTRQCLSALIEKTPDNLFELIIVDNASSDGTRDFLSTLEQDVKIITNNKNLGFAKSCNQGAKEAAGEYLVFLNNDTIPHRNWLAELIDVADAWQDVGIVGSKLLFPDNTVQHAGVAMLPVLSHLYRKSPSNFLPINKPRDLNAVTAACMLIRRELFLEVGGFNEEYINGCEDIDLCLSVRAAGKRVFYNPRSVLTHFEGQTPGREDKMNENRKLLFERWKGRMPADYKQYLLDDGFRASSKDPTNWEYHEELCKRTLSIVIVTYNSLSDIGPCLSSVQAQTNLPYEIIIVDNNSSDGTKDYLKSLKGFNVLINDENIGFSKACNQGIRIAKGEYIVLLNPDTQVTADWAWHMMLHFKNGVGAVGPVSNYVAGLQKFELYRKANIGKADNNEISKNFYNWNKNRGVETKLLVGFCMMIKRSVMDDIGLLDDDFFLGIEDLEYSWRLRQKGYKLIVATDVFIFHQGQKSFSTVLPEKNRRDTQAGQDKLYAKLEAHYGNGHVPSSQELWGMDWFRPSQITKSRLTSIIILCFNQIEYTKQCLQSIEKYTSILYELVLVDNGSTDGTQAFLQEYAKKHGACTLILNESNLGFAGGNNQGIAAAKGDYILLLNNDVVVTQDWLERLIAHIESDASVGMIGPVSNSISGPQLVKNTNYEQDLEKMHQFAQDHSKKNVGKIQEVLRVVGFCLLIKRNVLDVIGGLDENYGNGNFEDDDLCLRSCIAGFRNIIAHDVFIHHYGSMTFKGNSIDHRATMQGNRKYFADKWKDLIEVSNDGYRVHLTRNDQLKHLNKWGEERTSQGNFSGAVKIFERVLKLDSTNSQALVNLKNLRVN